MKDRSISLLYGIICHSSFAVGVGLMIYSLYFGLPTILVSIEPPLAIIWNLLLVAQFPILHSFFLSSKGRSILSQLAPVSVRRELGTTLFAWFASTQLILVFGLWAGTGVVIWQPSHDIGWIFFSVLYTISWLLLLKSMNEASLSLQTGALGWWAVFRGRKAVYRKFCQSGLHSYVRNPIYISFALTLWTAPVWTWDRIALVVPWTIYCLVGPQLKENRYRKMYGQEYLEYQRRVPYWLPWPRK